MQQEVYKDFDYFVLNQACLIPKWTNHLQDNHSWFWREEKEKSLFPFEC